MKKLVIAVLACAGLMAPAQDQDKVSLNTLGYIRNVSNLGLHIVALQFEMPTNTVEAVYGDTMPQGTQIYRFNRTSGIYNISTYGNVFVPTVGLVVKWGNPDLELTSGEGFWVQLPSEEVAVTNLFSGEVPSANTITNVLIPGYNLVSYPYPVDRVVTNLGIVPTLDDGIFTYVGGRYQAAVYTEVFNFETLMVEPGWDLPGLVIKAGTGFWYNHSDTNANKTWVAVKPF